MKEKGLTAEQKTKMYEQWVKGVFESKAEAARTYNTSPRTVGRVIEAYSAYGGMTTKCVTTGGVPASGSPTPNYTTNPPVETRDEDWYDEEDEDDWDEDFYHEMKSTPTVIPVAPVDSNDVSLREIDYESGGRYADNDYYDDEYAKQQASWAAFASPEDFYIFTASPNSISIVRERDGKQVSITKDDDSFEMVFNDLMEQRGSQEVLEILFSTLNVEVSFEKYSKDGIHVDTEANRVYYQNGAETFDFSGRLVTRLLSSLKQDGEYSDSFKGLIAFTQHLLNNPEKRAVEELYDFLEANDVTITEEGLVRCWKKIRTDWKDFHSGKFDNSVGREVKMPRHLVNNDSSVTCSTGLHACSRSYLSSFGGSDSRVVSVLVNPADFVSIPNDYNNAKARVCRYVVEAEVNPYTLQRVDDAEDDVDEDED